MIDNTECFKWVPFQILQYFGKFLLEKRCAGIIFILFSGPAMDVYIDRILLLPGCVYRMHPTSPSPGLSLQLQLVVIPCSAVIRGKKPMPLHEEESLFPYFWSQFLTDFDVTPLILKLRTSSTR